MSEAVLFGEVRCQARMGGLHVCQQGHPQPRTISLVVSLAPPTLTLVTYKTLDGAEAERGR